MEFVWIDNGCEYQPNKTDTGRFNVWKVLILASGQ